MKNKHKVDIIEELLNKIDVIPNSIVLAQAANESGWVMSRFAQEYNALFGEYTYDFSKGGIPLQREQGKTHFVKSFSSYKVDNPYSSDTALFVEGSRSFIRFPNIKLLLGIKSQ